MFVLLADWTLQKPITWIFNRHERLPSSPTVIVVGNFYRNWIFRPHPIVEEYVAQCPKLLIEELHRTSSTPCPGQSSLPARLPLYQCTKCTRIIGSILMEEGGGTSVCLLHNSETTYWANLREYVSLQLPGRDRPQCSCLLRLPSCTASLPPPPPD